MSLAFVAQKLKGKD